MSRTINLRAGSAAPAEEGTRLLTADLRPLPPPPPFPFLFPPVEGHEIGRLGNYRVLRLLGQGGMGFVFQAEDIGLRRAVALKVMKPDLDPDDPGGERFLREARLMASVKHEHVVTVFQVGQEGKVPYLAMELLQGKSLDQWMKRAGQVGVTAVSRLGRQIAAGLAAIHGHCLIHRDVKPANIWLEAPKGRVKILDFGLARVAGDAPHLTQTGMIVGTPSYMSPEQARGETLDARSDLFSLGCVLYELSCGVRPFQAPTTMAQLTALAVQDPRPVHDLRPDVPEELSDLIHQLLAKDAAERPPSAEAVAARLQQIENRLKTRPTAATQARPAPPASPGAPTDREPPTRARTPTRVKKSKALARRRRRKIWMGACLAATALAAVLTVTLAVALASGGGRRTPPTAPTSPLTAPTTATPTYLSDLQLLDDRNPLKAPPPPPPGRLPPPFNGVIVHDQPFPHGIFMHPAPTAEGGEASLRYDLGGRYAIFTAETSLNDGPGESETPLTFLVEGDGRLLWQSSRPLRGQADGESCNVAVAGVRQLTIRVTCPGFPRGAHAVWIDPKVAP